MSYNSTGVGVIMTARINQLGVGAQVLDSQNISPAHRQRVERSLLNIFSDQKIPIGNQKIPFHLKVEEGRTILRLQDREIILKKGPDLQAIERMARFYQHTGQLPRMEIAPQEEAFRVNATKKSVRMVSDASVPGTNGQILAGMRITQDTLSLTRNILFSIPAIGSQNPVVNHLGYYAGLFWAFFSFRELDEGVAEYKRSKIIQDAEGQRRAEIRLLSGAICSTASLSYLAGRICNTFSSSVGAAAAIGSANVLFGMGSFLAMGASLLGALRCSYFNDRIDEYLKHPKLTEVQKFQGVLHFLRDSISVTQEEREELAAQIEKEHPDWDLEKKEKQLQGRLIELTEVKVKHMKRRTSSKSLHLILARVDMLLNKLADPKTQAEGIQEAAALLRTIRRENKIKMVLYVLGFVAALISFIAMVVATFLTMGALPFALYGSAGAIYLATTVYYAVGVIFKKEPDRGTDLHPIQDLAPHGPHVGFA